MSLGMIGANIDAQWAYQTFSKINKNMSTVQLRMATGKKINTPEDDPAGYQLARSLEKRGRGLSVALQNVSNAKSVLNIAESAYQGIMDLLQVAKEKATQAADATLNNSQRTAIHNQIEKMGAEIDAIADFTTFNGNNLIDGSYKDGVQSLSFQVGEVGSNTLDVHLEGANSAALKINDINLTTAAGASSAMETIGAAIDTLSELIQDIGEYKTRLNSKESTLASAVTNTEAVRSNIEDADLVKEQMNMMKLQILQQTAATAFTQANAAPQMVLQLFG
ncbi:MAG TPA: flagellin [Candidatus Marinimicrobia bacterium]|nr:flagellin [Candidatus Neomarinimicrobiota bacterium]